MYTHTFIHVNFRASMNQEGVSPQNSIAKPLYTCIYTHVYTCYFSCIHEPRGRKSPISFINPWYMCVCICKYICIHSRVYNLAKHHEGLMFRCKHRAHGMLLYLTIRYVAPQFLIVWLSVSSTRTARTTGRAGTSRAERWVIPAGNKRTLLCYMK